MWVLYLQRAPLPHAPQDIPRRSRRKWLLLPPGALAVASWPLHSLVVLSSAPRRQGEEVEGSQKGKDDAAAQGPSGMGKRQQESLAVRMTVENEGEGSE